MIQQLRHFYTCPRFSCFEHCFVVSVVCILLCISRLPREQSSVKQKKHKKKTRASNSFCSLSTAVAPSFFGGEGVAFASSKHVYVQAPHVCYFSLDTAVFARRGTENLSCAATYAPNASKHKKLVKGCRYPIYSGRQPVYSNFGCMWAASAGLPVSQRKVAMLIFAVLQPQRLSLPHCLSLLLLSREGGVRLDRPFPSSTYIYIYFFFRVEFTRDSYHMIAMY